MESIRIAGQEIPIWAIPVGIGALAGAWLLFHKQGSVLTLNSAMPSKGLGSGVMQDASTATVADLASGTHDAAKGAEQPPSPTEPIQVPDILRIQPVRMPNSYSIISQPSPEDGIHSIIPETHSGTISIGNTQPNIPSAGVQINGPFQGGGVEDYSPGPHFRAGPNTTPDILAAQESYLYSIGALGGGD